MHDVIIGTAGHIDHGKTTLIKALTGIDADRLVEEKRRGITIDIGFAHFELDGFRVGFIDVPGHERFVKNMLTGIGGIDLVMLVIAADESVMPQTVEHFQICRLLEIPGGLIVLTKKNNVDEELLELVGEEVRDLVAGSFLEDAPIIAVDSLSGQGIGDLSAALLKAVEGGQVKSRQEASLFRLPVDRVFTIRGFGTVVTGTPWRGRVDIDQTLQVYPGGEQVKVRGIEIFNQKSQAAAAGQRTALNLSGAETHDIQRGMLLAPPRTFQPSQMIDVELRLLEDAPTPLKHASPVRFHHGSGELLGRVYFPQGEKLAQGSRSIAQLRLDSPTVCCLGDRFVIRRYSPMVTIGGGVVLDPAPRKRKRHERADSHARLEALARTWREGQAECVLRAIEYYSETAGPEGIDLHGLASRTGLLSERIAALLSQSDDLEVVPQSPALAVSKSTLKGLAQQVETFLSGFHRRNPLAAGAQREEVKERFLRNASGTYFQHFLESLQMQGLICSKSDKVRLASHRVQLDESQQEIRRGILQLIGDGGLNPPSLDDLLARLAKPSDQVRDVFYYLLDAGELARITDGIVLTSQGLEEMIARLRQRFASGDAFSVADFKDLLGVSRKYAIPYLEYLDRQRITQRQGDRRVLKSA